MDKVWMKYKYKYKTRNLFHKPLCDYAGKKIINIERTNQVISSYIQTGKEFMVGRFGATEMQVLVSFLQKKHFPYIDNTRYHVKKLCNLSGFFPNDIKYGERFAELLLESCKMIDLCGTWNLNMEEYVLDRYASQALITRLDYLEPWRMDNKIIKPWSHALKGKRVLVIHPFSETISHQYALYRERIFSPRLEADDILPKFELKTLQAVQSLNCNIENVNFRNWFEALKYMQDECTKIDFDVAIIGCGAYGFPLAAFVKQIGKGAIHLGGATQILFGIMGKRWEIGEYHQILSQYINEYWTRPLESEKPKKADNIEGGCYW